MLYKVLITETRQRPVCVEAQNAQEAHRRAIDAFENVEFMMDSDDVEGVEAHVVGPVERADNLQRVRGKDEY